jgi:uncharacterized protein DUF5655/uncharacterized protein DUF4287
MAARKTKVKSIYGVHPGVLMAKKSLDELPASTGRSLEQWMQVIKKEGPSGNRERCEWLKSKHGFGSYLAGWLADRAEGKGAEDYDPEAYLAAAENYVKDMFAGTKEALLPLYRELLKIGLSVGSDVKACPGKTIVPLYRKHVFAQIKPATLTRIDFGFALGGIKGDGRLIETGGFAKKDRITHRIGITSLADIDDEAKRWLKAAYDLDA